MTEILDRKRRFQRGIGSSPFESLPVPGCPFTTFGLEWCDHCRMAVDCDTKAAHRGTVYVYKRWCLRCGKILKRGVFNNVPILSGTPLPAAALEWTTAPERFKR